jgi:hypothetical protein
MLSEEILQKSEETEKSIQPKRIGIINVGANASHGSLRSPIFDNGGFEFVPIPDSIMDYLKATNSVKYRDLKPANGIGFNEFLGEHYHNLSAHSDPEFDTRTYGDYPSLNPRASNLRKLSKGDLLFFFARLVGWRNGRFTKDAGFYIIGGIKIGAIYRDINKRPPNYIYDRIKRNAHVIRGETNPILYDGFWIFKGTRTFGRFKYAVPLDRKFVEDCGFTDRNFEHWKWDMYRTELSAIGSYLRSSKVIENRREVERFLRVLSKQQRRIKS